MTESKMNRRGVLKAMAVGTAAAAGMRAARIAHASGPVGESPHQWAMVIDQSKCTGCQYCVNSCQAHNDIHPDIQWTRLHNAEPVNGQEVFMPVPCMHCENAPCVSVCPVKATYQRDDGIVMMDQHRCIGCRYCMAACPYGSRSFNWQNPWETAEGEPVDVPNPEFPKRTRGVVEKCNLCAERLAKGLVPRCVEACRHGALTFGDASDPDSEVRKLLASGRAIRRKVHLGTEPHVFYLV